MRRGLLPLLAGLIVALAAPTVDAINTDPVPRARLFIEATIDESLTKAFDEAPESSQRVYVGLAMPYTPEHQLTPAEIATQRAAIAADQDKVQTALDLVSATHHNFVTVAGFAVTVTESEFESLALHPLVASVTLEVLETTTLDATPGLVGADTLWGQTPSVTGKGQAIAILDTGVDLDHAMFDDGSGGSRVVDGACFSTNAVGITTLCPGGGTREFGAAAGNDCPAGTSGCDHGTHVAGIAAGGMVDSGGGVMVSGIAPDANIISLQVFSQVNVPNTCARFNRPTPCTLSYPTDQIAALEYLFELDDDFGGPYDIAAANMSLGGGQFTEACDNDDPLNLARSRVMFNLGLSAGIAVPTASGNSSFSDSVGVPACLSTNVTVGATTDADLIWNLSNYERDLVDIHAPGVAVLSAVPGDNYASFNGTSMATPHVAGAWALLKQSLSGSPASSVSTILWALQRTASKVSTRENGSIFANARGRINIDAAAAELANIVTYNVRVAMTGDGEGRVGVTDGESIDSIDKSCIVDCDTTVVSGAALSLIPQANPGSRFVQWLGCPSVNVFNNGCSLSKVTADTEVTAQFALIRPDNDNRASATDLGNAAEVELSQSTVNATLEVGEASPSCDDTAGRSVWFTWQGPASLDTKVVRIGTRNSDFDAVLDVFSVAGNGDLTELGCSVGTEANGYTDAMVTFPPREGQTYAIRVSGFKSLSGQLALTLGIDLPPAVINAVEVGNESLTFTLSAPGVWSDTVLGYFVQCIDSNNNNTALTVEGAGPVTLEGLANDESYSCVAASAGNVGLSSFSDPVVATPEFSATGIPVWLLKEAADRSAAP